MSQAYNFQALLAEAQKEGIGGSLLPDGPYTLLAKVVKVSNSQAGKDQIGVMWQVVDGPSAGQTSWENQTISPENPKAMAAFFGWCAKFGMDAVFFQRQPQPTLPEIASVIHNLVVQANVGNKTWGKNNDKKDNTFKIVTILGKQGAAPVAPTAPVAPVAAPVVAVAPVAPVAVAPVAVAPEAPAPVYVAPAPVAVLPAAPVALIPAAPVAEVPQPTAAIDPATGLPVRTF